MRIDKFLKVSRLIKRRSVASEACDGGRIIINGKVVKPSASVKANDKVSIAFGTRTITFVVNNIAENVKKEEATSMYTIIGDE